MAGEGGVSLPGVGKVSKKWVMIVAAGSAVSIGYFVYKRKKSAAAAATTTTDTTATTGQIDPQTGEIAGSTADLAALQSGGYGSGMYGASGGYYSGYGAMGTSGITPPVPGTGGFTTNGQWAQQAETDLGALGISQLALAAALGNYLTGRPLNGAQESLVNQAIAEENYPPVAGPGNYPPNMHITPTGPGSGGGGGGGGGGQVSVPNVLHHRVNDAIAILRSAGFSYHSSQTRDPRHEYTVDSQSPGPGKTAAHGSVVDLGIRQIK